MTELEKIVSNIENLGYSLEFNSDDNTIKTRRGRIKIIQNEWKGQPYCLPLKNEINIFMDNQDVVDDIIHEKTHFDIFPYDFISYNIGMAGFFGTAVYNSPSNFHTVLIGIIGAFTYFNPLVFNLYSDCCVRLYNKIKFSRKI